MCSTPRALTPVSVTCTLAGRPATAICGWRKKPRARALSARANRSRLDELLASLAAGERAGIDCPFGWPTAFVAAVSAHAGHEPWPGDMGQDGYYRSLRLRSTD